jgi:hypothetical protein
MGVPDDAGRGGQHRLLKSPGVERLEPGERNSIAVPGRNSPGAIRWALGETGTAGRHARLTDWERLRSGATCR